MPRKESGSKRKAPDLRKCACSELRRASRRLTQLYDQALEPAGLTIGQFGLLAHLAKGPASNARAVALGLLAEERGMDPTTLTRNIKPLVTKGWIEQARDGDDRRVRALVISASGREKYRAARPLWRRAQRELETALGSDTLSALLDLLDVSLAKIG